MTLLVTLNGRGIESMELTFPADHLFALEARLAGDLGVVPGGQVTVQIGNNLTFNVDVEKFGSVAADRWNLCSFAPGSFQLRQNCTPTYLVNPTASAILSAAKVANYTFLQGAPSLPSYGVILPGTITWYQALRRYLGDNMRILYDGTLEIGVRAPQNNTGVFQVLDYNAQNNLMTLGIGDDFMILPSDILFGAVVLSVKYEYSADEMRAVCEMASPPTYVGSF